MSLNEETIARLKALVRSEIRNNIHLDVEECFMHLKDALLPHFLTAPEGQNQLKKAKASEAYAVFNFDDLPEYEPLEMTLVSLRANEVDKDALKKVLVMDMSDLCEHPQWEELLSILLKPLLSANREAALLSLQIHAQFIRTYSSAQVLQPLLNVFRLFFQLFRISSDSIVIKSAHSRFSFDISDSHTEFIMSDSLLSASIELLVEIAGKMHGFYCILTENESGLLLCSFFTIISYGEIVIPSIESSKCHIQVMELLFCRYSTELSQADVFFKWPRYSFLLHAIHSDFISTLDFWIRNAYMDKERGCHRDEIWSTACFFFFSIFLPYTYNLRVPTIFLCGEGLVQRGHSSLKFENGLPVTHYIDRKSLFASNIDFIERNVPEHEESWRCFCAMVNGRIADAMLLLDRSGEVTPLKLPLLHICIELKRQMRGESQLSYSSESSSSPLLRRCLRHLPEDVPGLFLEDCESTSHLFIQNISNGLTKLPSLKRSWLVAFRLLTEKARASQSVYDWSQLWSPTAALISLYKETKCYQGSVEIFADYMPTFEQAISASVRVVADNNCIDGLLYFHALSFFTSDGIDTLPLPEEMQREVCTVIISVLLQPMHADVVHACAPSVVSSLLSFSLCCAAFSPILNALSASATYVPWTDPLDDLLAKWALQGCLNDCLQLLLLRFPFIPRDLVSIAEVILFLLPGCMNYLHDEVEWLIDLLTNALRNQDFRRFIIRTFEENKRMGCTSFYSAEAQATIKDSGGDALLNYIASLPLFLIPEHSNG